MSELKQDPYNLIITGVGGQGNVLASRLVGDILAGEGFNVTIGETFGASQRGGSVMSHLRATRGEGLSPQIPLGQAHMVVSLEPAEAIRVLAAYGNPRTKVISNMRPVMPVSVVSGQRRYPFREELMEHLKRLSARAWFLDTTELALELGNPIFSNVILVGALAKSGELPISREGFERVIRQRFPADKAPPNLKAFDLGREMLV